MVTAVRRLAARVAAACQWRRTPARRTEALRVLSVYTDSQPTRLSVPPHASASLRELAREAPLRRHGLDRTT